MTLRQWLIAHARDRLYRPMTGTLCTIQELTNRYSVYLDAPVFEEGPVLYFRSYTRPSGRYPDDGIAILLGGIR